MADYLEGLCVFICLGDLMAHFMPSDKFLKLYRHIAGVLILLLLLKPLGKEVFVDGDRQESFHELERRLAGWERLWNAEDETEMLADETEKMTQAYLGGLTDETLKEKLKAYGYEIEETEGNAESIQENRGKTDYGKEGN